MGVRMLAAALPFILLSFASCATHKDSVALRQELHASNVRLSTLEYRAALLDSLVREQQQLNMTMRAGLTQEMQGQNDQLSMIAARQDELNYLLHNLLDQMESIQLYGGLSAAQPDTTSAEPAAPATTPIPSPEAAAPASGAMPRFSVNPEDLYQAAVDDLNQGNYAIAESRFLTFLIQFPDNDLAENAQFWLGEAALGQGKFDIAIQEFDKLIAKYPKSAQVPQALLRKGQAQAGSGDTAAAISTWEQLIQSHPNAEAATEAQRLITASANAAAPADTTQAMPDTP